MYLKALNVVGFKSFADKTTIQFHPGITAIVGPNGCGKSNVLDSIRWVLGEQSAKALRGGQMQDIIFSGSDTRKALGMAEVSLTFGDCETELGLEYHEVTITRRLFRDGSSEYELNKTPCRLRDIHQLFMDTGIGRTAYSIMEQGKIDQILSARPEDRRAVFEEAAGITKFKSQKKEALRKLEHTETNLVRLEDIVREVRRQLGSLQRQAQKAKRYQELFKNLRELELRVARHQYDLLVAEIAELDTQAQHSRSTHEQLTLTVENEDGALARLRSELTHLEGELTQFRDELNLARRQAERAEQREQTNTTRVQEFTDLRETCRLEISSNEEKIRVQEELQQSLQQQLNDFSANVAAAKAAHDEKDKHVRAVSFQVNGREAARAVKQQSINRVESQLSALRNQATALEMQQKNTLLRVESLRDEQANLNRRSAEAESQRVAQQAEWQTAEATLQASKARLAQVREEIQGQSTAARAAEQAQREAQTAWQKLQARVDALLQLETSHADSPPATQKILQAVTKGELTAQLSGTLSDHLQITPGYESPIALLLGEAVNALLIEDKAGAQAILTHLRDKKEGQVVLAPRHIPRADPTPISSETSALRFVQADEKVQPLVLSLLAEAHIVADAETAWELKHKYPQALIATVDGLLMTSAGLILCGKTSGAAVAVFARRNERKELESQLTALHARSQESARLAVTATEALQASQGTLQQVQAEVQAAEIQSATLRHTQQTLAQSVREIETTAQRAHQELTRLLTQEEQDRARQTKVQEETSLRTTELATWQEELAAIITELEALQTSLNQERQLLVEQQIQVATLGQQQQGWQQQVTAVQTRLNELRELTATRTREATDYEQKVTLAQAEILAAQTEKTTALARSQELTAKLEQLGQHRQDHQNKIEEREKALRDERKKLSEVQTVQTDCEVKLAQRRIVLDHLNEHITQTYQLEIKEFTPEALASEEAPDWLALEAQVKEMREKIDSMGPVNLESIAEYEELEERLKFLETQQADLTNAKQQLLQAIAEINLTTEKMFAETFEQVKKNFQSIFSELFGGGKATLELSDDKNPLECGIEIVARPPGKQPQSITLLSGGEKTMTAVSLLFAIYMVKPSPFCVLDEMDAPLDESNINRFIKMVQRFTEHSQFVIITHNKRTISMADALYGVTMPERGCSTLMSVKLSKEDKEKADRVRPTVSPTELTLLPEEESSLSA